MLFTMNQRRWMQNGVFYDDEDAQDVSEESMMRRVEYDKEKKPWRTQYFTRICKNK